jgi:hypothetical protein
MQIRLAYITDGSAIAHHAVLLQAARQHAQLQQQQLHFALEIQMITSSYVAFVAVYHNKYMFTLTV